MDSESNGHEGVTDEQAAQDDRPTDLVDVPAGRELWIARQEAQQRAGDVTAREPCIPRSADLDYWRTVDKLEPGEAALLSLGVDARPGGEGATDCTSVEEALKWLAVENWPRISERQRVIERRYPDGLSPRELAALARDMSWAVPAALDASDMATNGAAPDGETRLERAQRLAKQEIVKQLAKGRPYPLEGDLVDYLMINKHVDTKSAALAVLKVIRPDDLKRGPRDQRDDAADE